MRDKDGVNANENMVSEGEKAGARLSFTSPGLALSSSCDGLTRLEGIALHTGESGITNKTALFSTRRGRCVASLC